MRSSLFAVILFVPLSAYAADLPCNATVAEKHLAGAAKTSFMTKCEADTKARCEQAATDYKTLSGAAKTSFTTKCIKDGIG